MLQKYSRVVPQLVAVIFNKRIGARTLFHLNPSYQEYIKKPKTTSKQSKKQGRKSKTLLNNILYFKQCASFPTVLPLPPFPKKLKHLNKAVTHSNLLPFKPFKTTCKLTESSQIIFDQTLKFGEEF
eukprot:TRINITY_DN9420_c0_g1_i4.p9 TRINITY_DN9420_c0_g1~~TRINITY_DN9420_c0_g1_i4.p9  ORF type:complete len:126 (-),score=3.92 TRINITY_DN9420_c0_g1_i4:283-660(-)